MPPCGELSNAISTKNRGKRLSRFSLADTACDETSALRDNGSLVEVFAFVCAIMSSAEDNGKGHSTAEPTTINMRRTRTFWVRREGKKRRVNNAARPPDTQGISNERDNLPFLEDGALRVHRSYTKYFVRLPASYNTWYTYTFMYYLHCVHYIVLAIFPVHSQRLLVATSIGQ
ncbi:hypothetical protein M440DRAFT_188231 [Trichoderma longibrachiatum ATCC 18648]|uniref:Uncharacterized protein n=1 Tax=Trichoderma longibrachiatum ATCC 18648 TaxID=983965 RepID=A0A2T4CFC2_TRILO|nr:hypothetical protein M440DRAFT_188231 [Trichoderma longibrachiatum ATCC 18648]